MKKVSDSVRENEMQASFKGRVSSNVKFSVLMPVYYKEQPENFENAIKSILIDQIRKPDEFLLVCDGPLEDELNQIIQSYKIQFPQIFKVYRLKENMGLGKALKAGLMKCSYDIVARADSDDICAPERFQVQLAFLDYHKDIEVVSSYIDEFYDDWRKPCRYKEVPLVHDEIVKMARYRNPINHMAVMFRKSAIISTGSYRHVPYIEDYDLWVRMMEKGYRFANVNQYLVHARIGNGMVKRRGNKEQIRSWRIINRYMLGKKMINHVEYFRNMISVIVFVYMLSEMKEWMYRLFLRK